MYVGNHRVNFLIDGLVAARSQPPKHPTQPPPPHQQRCTELEEELALVRREKKGLEAVLRDEAWAKVRKGGLFLNNDLRLFPPPPPPPPQTNTKKHNHNHNHNHNNHNNHNTYTTYTTN